MTSQSTSAAEDAGSTQPVEPLRVSKIVIEGLFRRYDHVIELRQKERVTILHGKNGVGKTVTLGLIDGLFTGRYGRLFETPFSKMRVDFTDGSWVSVERVPIRVGTVTQGSHASDSLSELNGRKEIVYVVLKIEGQYPPNHPVRCQLNEQDMQLDLSADAPPWLKRMGANLWLDTRTSAYIGIQDLVRIYPALHYRYINQSVLSSPALYDRVPAEFRDLCRKFAVYYVETQRLLELQPTPLRVDSMIAKTSVKAMAEHMAARIREIDSIYRSTATELDSSLPRRMLGSKPQAKMDVDTIRERNEKLEQERDRLRRIGLLKDKSQSFDLDELVRGTERAHMFALYLDDTEKKLKVFDSLAERAEFLLDRMNKKLSPKRIILDKDDGYRVLSHDEQPIELEWLSSGEQHELVLLHSLLFQVKPGTLVLIDEPELSLHLVWQKELLSDLLRIAEIAKLDIILATHSPYIVGDRRELMVQLGGPE